MSEDRLKGLAEASRRGLLNPEQQGAFEEASRRGLANLSDSRPAAGQADAGAAPADTGSAMGAAGSGFMHGLGNILYGGAQLGARMQEPTGFSDIDQGLAGRVDRATSARQKAYEESPQVKGHPIASGIGEFGGEVVGTSPLMLLPGGQATTAGRLGMSALGGAAAGALSPTTGEGDFWSQKLGQGARGAAGGAVAGGAGEVLSRAVSPSMTAAAQSLSDKGITLTPGQAMGGSVRRVEEAFKSYPILGNFIRGSEKRSIESFNVSALNQALEPIGQALPKGIEAGHEANKKAANLIGDAYDDILSKLNFKVDAPFAQNMAQLRTLASEMPATQRDQFEAILTNRLEGRLKGGVGLSMDGQTLKQVESEFRNFADQYRRSPDAAQRQLGSALNQTRQEIRDAVARQNGPDNAQRLRNIDYSYAMLVRMEDAASRRGASEGVFRPVDLRDAIRSGDKTVRHRAFAQGDALLQDFAEAAQSVLPGKMPDSGTIERGATILGGSELLAHMLGAGPGLELGAAAPLLGTPLYTEAGQRLFNQYARPGPTRQAAGKGLRAADPYLAPAAGILGAGM